MVIFLVIAGLVVFWLACGLVGYGWTFAYFQRKYPFGARLRYNEDRREALLDFIFGPLGLAADLSLGWHKQGWKWR